MNTTHTSGQLIKFLELLEQRDCNTVIFQHLLSQGTLADIFDRDAVIPDREELRKLLKLKPLVPEVIILSVNFGMTVDQMVAAGNYDWKNDDLNAKNFPVIGEGVQEFEFDLVDPKGDISSEKALKLIEKDSDPENPWIPAQTEHLLAIGAAFPDLQRKNPIVALGSVAMVYGDRHVPFLFRHVSKRGLYLHYYDLDWRSYYRFLRVRKVSVPQASSPSA